MKKGSPKEAVKNWLVPSDLSEVSRVSAEVLVFLAPLDLTEACSFDVRLCLEEALINAMKYGNGLRREIPVDLQVGYNGGKVWIRMEDRGEGFDFKKIGDCTKDENRMKQGGRGVYLIHQLMDEVKYNSRGNGVLMIKSIRAAQDGCQGEKRCK